MLIDFTVEQLSILDKAIQQLPYYLAAPMVLHINSQLAAQQKAMDVPVDVEQ